MLLVLLKLSCKQQVGPFVPEVQKGQNLHTEKTVVFLKCMYFFKDYTFPWSKKLLITAAALITEQNACEEGSHTCPALPARGGALPAGTWRLQ